MQWIGLGKVPVPSSGTPVKLSLVRKAIHSIIVTYDPADAGSVFIKDPSGFVIATMRPTVSSAFILASGSGQNALDLSQFEIDSSASGGGPYVGYSVG